MASVTVLFGGKEEKTYQLDKPRLVVGREPPSEIVIDNLGISRHHCAFEQKGGVFVVKDLGSSNGTYVNGRKITEHYLNDQDEVMVGKYSLRFRNEAQRPAQTQTDDATVPDTDNTYVVAPPQLQAQLAKLRGAPQTVMPGVSATAKDFAKAYDARPDPSAEKTKNLITILLVVIGVLTVAVIALVVLLFMNRA